MTSTQPIFQAFETIGTVDESGVLSVAPFVGIPAGEVRVSVAVPQPNVAEDEYTLEEITEEEWRRGMQSSSALAFLADPAEDIYTLEDGEPIVWEKP